ncbi:MAG: restriction endonuclease, partial [Candidatus Cloacimonadaceae bacterium]|nr:restriction endonuclease [Candidatus Cloacimonadaceae bacterium]
MENKQNTEEIIIKKASGDTEPFDVSKLKSSLRKAGAGEGVITDIVADIEKWVYSGVTTRKIYSRAYKIFKQQSNSGALLYKLKMAINSMGPSGYPFERFIGELFKRQDYEVEVGQVLQGASITHEMDVIATKGNEHILVECKFSHNQGKYISIQVPLYVYSRINDIVEKMQQEKRYKDTKFSAWIVTNTRFSADSIAFSKSKG